MFGFSDITFMARNAGVNVNSVGGVDGHRAYDGI